MLISDWALRIHLGIALIALGILSSTLIQALLLLWQEHQLRHGHLNSKLPPIERMETVLFFFVALGFCSLSLIMISSLLTLPIQHVATKLTLATLAWCIFALLLIGRWLWGWRGWIALRWTFLGSLLFMLCFFPSATFL